jgi:hypothetical protein
VVKYRLKETYRLTPTITRDGIAVANDLVPVGAEMGLLFQFEAYKYKAEWFLRVVLIRALIQPNRAEATTIDERSKYANFSMDDQSPSPAPKKRKL